MKIHLLFTIAIFTLNSISYSQKQIRNANWGWSRDSVKKSENLKLISGNKDRLLYFGSLANDKYSIAYKFTKNKLTEVTYAYMEKHINLNNYISAYDKIQDILTKKYGEPLKDETIWKDDLYKNNPNNFGLACSAGHVSFISTWENSDTHIMLLCTGENFDITVGILYSSLEYSNLEKQKSEEQNNKDF